MSARVDLTGQKFGRLTVIDFSHRRINQSMWNCICECGNKVVVGGYDIRSGNTSSCGCLWYDNMIKVNTTHGLAGRRIYVIWQHMIRRCTNPKDKRYSDYGGRGIKVCERWFKFENFYEDMKVGYDDKLTLDRFPNKNGDYEPNNCRWATYTQQNRNRRDNRYLACNGVSMTLAEWAEKMNVDVRLIHHRLNRGWDEEAAILTPKLRDYKKK